MQHLDAYPTLRQRVFTDQWAKDFLNTSLAETGTLANLIYPGLYLVPFYDGYWPPDYLTRAEAGLKFLVKKAASENLSDLIGNLRKGQGDSAEFELMLAWALSTHFGDQNVVAYPRISRSGKSTADFALVRGGNHLLVEATILFDDEASAKETLYCLEHGITCPPGITRNAKWDAERLLKKCSGKIHEKGCQESLFLCIDQQAWWPERAIGAEVVGQLLASETLQTDSPFVGMAYFYMNRLFTTVFAEARAQALGADPDLLTELRSALRLLSW